MEHSPPFLCLYVSSPVDNYISSNTFIHFIDPNADVEETIGLIVNNGNNNTAVRIHHFFSLLQLSITREPIVSEIFLYGP
jgi:hypothetical protein